MTHPMPELLLSECRKAQQAALARAEPVSESEVFPEGFEDVIGRRVSMPEVVVKS